MNKEELEGVIEVIMERGNPIYTTPSGALLELLREKARNKDIHLIAECASLYSQIYPEAELFIRRRIPGILVNHYFVIREDLDYNKFIQWSIQNPEWANQLIEHAFNPEALSLEVEKIIAVANDFNE